MITEAATCSRWDRHDLPQNGIIDIPEHRVPGGYPKSEGLNNLGTDYGDAETGPPSIFETTHPNNS